MKRFALVVVLAAVVAGCGSAVPLSTFEKTPAKLSRVDSLYHANQVRVLTDRIREGR